MRWFIKISLGIIVLFVLSIGIDLFSIYQRNKPIFAIKDNNIYYGLLYDIYDCEEYSSVQIKLKWSKYSCPKESIPLEVTTNFTIIDKTENCNEVLEQFYEDDDYKYYFLCKKSDTTFLNFGKYFNGDDVIFTVKDALEKKMVNIKYLEEKGLEFIKEPKIEILVELDNEKKLTKLDKKIDNNSIYYYGLKSVKVKKETKIDDFINMIEDKEILNQIINEMDYIDTYKDGGSKLYRFKSTTNTGYSILKCHTIDGNNDLYIGDYQMNYEEHFCKGVIEWLN